MGDGKNAYRVVVRVNGGEPRGGYSGFDNAYEAVRSCIDGISDEIRGSGKLEIDFFEVSKDQIKRHIIDKEEPRR
jgi:hypothetical protein